MNAPANEVSPVLMPKRSRYAGRPVDVSTRRSITLRMETLEEERVVLDYFYHEGTFWTATLPLDGVAEIFGQSMNFSSKKTKSGEHGREVIWGERGIPKYTVPLLNHIQTRFVMGKGQSVDLYPLGHDITGTPTYQIHDFVYSLEAVGPPGVTFNVRDAYFGNLVAAHRFVSTTEIVFERIVVEDYYISESPPIPLSNAEKKAVLLESLKRSHRSANNEKYRLFHLVGTNNCTSTPFHIVDKVRKYPFWRRLGTMLFRAPLNPRLYLRIRGLDSDPSDRKRLRDQFQEYIDEPATQQRKREHKSTGNK